MFLVFSLSLVLALSPAGSRSKAAVRSPEVAKVEENKGGTEASPAENFIVDKGVRVEFTVEPAHGLADEPKPILEGDYAEVRFRITDATTGAPVSPLEPAVWISRVGETGDDMSCRDRISRYIQGMLSFQAEIDLNKYFILIMNNDQSISVVDPLLGVSGITQLYAMIILKEPGEDWVPSPDGKKLFVTMPKADSVAVVNLENFKVIENVEAGSRPIRIALQPDGKYLWVGNDGKAEERSGVTVIDPRRHAVAAHIPTGAGHHEIAFSDDSLFAFVTNSIQGTVSVIDTQKLEKIKDLSTGKYPIAVQFSSLSQSAYVAARHDGTITVVDGAKQEIAETIRTEPGLIALRFAPGDRWLFSANMKHDRVDVIDASQGSIAHSFKVGDMPHQFAFTDTYGYVRHLGTSEIKLIPLAQLGEKATVGLQTVVMGKRNPGAYAYGAVADSISPTGEWAAVVVANPADKMVYYYMEGMIAPMGSYPAYGRVPRAVGVVDRSVRETQKGVYAAKIRVPKAGIYNVAFLIDSPWVDHCFTFTAEANPLIKAEEEKYPVRLEFLNKHAQISIQQPFKLRFSLTRSLSGEPLSDLKDVVVLATRMPGNWQQRKLAKALGEGRYEVSFVPDQPGVYLISVGVPSLQVEMTELPYWSFRATKTTKAEKGM
jgi:YVTN family beta-propeller protein